MTWFRHVQRMDEYRMARMVLMPKIIGGRFRGALTRLVMRRAMVPSVTEMRVAKSHCGVHKGR